MIRSQKIYLISFVLALAVIPALAVVVPRILAYIPALTGILGYVSYAYVFKESPARSKPAFVIVGICMVMMMMSYFWAIDPSVSLERAQKTSMLLVCGAFLISAALSLRITALAPYLKMLPFVLFATAALACLEIGLNYPLYRLVRGFEFDLDVSLAVFNRATVTISLLLIPSLAIMRHYYSAQICLLLVLAAIVPLLMMGESQSAMLALLVGLATYYAFPYKWKYSWAVMTACIAGLMLILPFMAMWVFGHYAADIEAVPGLGSGGGYAGARMEIWDYVSRYALQNPLYGFGVEATRQVQNFGSGEIYQQGQTILHPHNYTLQLWMEFGVIGVALGAALIGYLLFQIRKLPVAQARMTLSTLFAALSVASTGYGMWQGWWLGLLFVVVVYCIFAVRLMDEDQVLPASNT